MFVGGLSHPSKPPGQIFLRLCSPPGNDRSPRHVAPQREKLIRNAFHKRLIRLERLSDIRNRHSPNELWMTCATKRAATPFASAGCPNYICHVQRKEIAGVQESPYRLQIDVVCIEKVGFFQPNSFTAASAAARVALGSEPIIKCSRLDLFHTGTTSIPAAAAITHAASCASSPDAQTCHPHLLNTLEASILRSLLYPSSPDNWSNQFQPSQLTTG